MILTIKKSFIALILLVMVFPPLVKQAGALSDQEVLKKRKTILAALSLAFQQNSSKETYVRIKDAALKLGDELEQSGRKEEATQMRALVGGTLHSMIQYSDQLKKCGLTNEAKLLENEFKQNIFVDPCTDTLELTPAIGRIIQQVSQISSSIEARVPVSTDWESFRKAVVENARNQIILMRANIEANYGEGIKVKRSSTYIARHGSQSQFGAFNYLKSLSPLYGTKIPRNERLESIIDQISKEAPQTQAERDANKKSFFEFTQSEYVRLNLLEDQMREKSIALDDFKNFSKWWSKPVQNSSSAKPSNPLGIEVISPKKEIKVLPIFNAKEVVKNRSYLDLDLSAFRKPDPGLYLRQWVRAQFGAQVPEWEKTDGEFSVDSMSSEILLRTELEQFFPGQSDAVIEQLKINLTNSIRTEQAKGKKIFSPTELDQIVQRSFREATIKDPTGADTRADFVPGRIFSEARAQFLTAENDNRSVNPLMWQEPYQENWKKRLRPPPTDKALDKSLSDYLRLSEELLAKELDELLLSDDPKESVLSAVNGYPEAVIQVLMSNPEYAHLLCQSKEELQTQKENKLKSELRWQKVKMVTRIGEGVAGVGAAVLGGPLTLAGVGVTSLGLEMGFLGKAAWDYKSMINEAREAQLYLLGAGQGSDEVVQKKFEKASDHINEALLSGAISVAEAGLLLRAMKVPAVFEKVSKSKEALVSFTKSGFEKTGNGLGWVWNGTKTYASELKGDWVLKRLIMKNRKAPTPNFKAGGLLTEVAEDAALVEARASGSVLANEAKSAQTVEELYPSWKELFRDMTKTDLGKAYDFTPLRGPIHALEKAVLPKGKEFTLLASLGGMGALIYARLDIFGLMDRAKEAEVESFVKNQAENGLNSDYRFERLNELPEEVRMQKAQELTDSLAAARRIRTELDSRPIPPSSQEVVQAYFGDKDAVKLFSTFAFFTSGKITEVKGFREIPGASWSKPTAATAFAIFDSIEKSNRVVDKAKDWFVVNTQPQLLPSERSLYESLKKDDLVQRLSKAQRNQKITQGQFLNLLREYVEKKSIYEQLELVGMQEYDVDTGKTRGVVELKATILSKIPTE